jgi:diaminohydroxyphosphoribosylaminopyrimidine deaminase/5-amino-6-(5-phosphoribosylamino)uracil reductase
VQAPDALVQDRRFMAAAIRLSHRHSGLTDTNPSVGALIVKDGAIVGSAVTAIGGRPHAETQALAQAGDRARGATAYVTLEPCAHYGRTPPCAEALVAAGVRRVVCGAPDPDHRVTGRGFAILQNGNVSVEARVLQTEASEMLSGYLTRSLKRRPEVTLKLAVSADSMIGRKGSEPVAITGPVAGRQVHLLRAFSDAILIGIGTALADDPRLTCRLPGLEQRSPARFILDPSARLPLASRLAQTSQTVPTTIVADEQAARPADVEALRDLGVDVLFVPHSNGELDLPGLLQGLARRGISTLMVEGGAVTASAFLRNDLVDRIVLLTGPEAIGAEGIAAPLLPAQVPERFMAWRENRFGNDLWQEWVRAV